MRGHVFLSYSHNRDGVYVDRLAHYLEAAGVLVWYDRELVTGERWERMIREKINTCAAFVVVMTPEAEESDWVTREVNHADNQDKPILPLLLRGQPFLRLNNLHYEDVTGARMPGNAFVTRLWHLTAPPPPEPAPPAPSRRQSSRPHSVVSKPEPSNAEPAVNTPVVPTRIADADDQNAEIAAPAPHFNAQHLGNLASTVDSSIQDSAANRSIVVPERPAMPADADAQARGSGNSPVTSVVTDETAVAATVLMPRKGAETILASWGEPRPDTALGLAGVPHTGEAVIAEGQRHVQHPAGGVPPRDTPQLPGLDQAVSSIPTAGRPAIAENSAYAATPPSRTDSAARLAALIADDQPIKGNPRSILLGIVPGSITMILLCVAFT